ncbi:hypothetical protein B0H14DRAFT_2586585 [Mycena olivaceomarginata]|nr:hypothetical protein B0H14DRAFT_2586585 [Mycena olivaceomarginata]
MVGNIQKKPAPAPQKSPKDHSDVTITHNGKRVKMTKKMLGDALMDPSMYPGFVEGGMDIIKEVLRNRNGRFKCITCDRGGARGKAINDRPIPPKADHPYLEGCKFPLRGAALELWMIKVTAGMAGVPQSGEEDVTARRLAFNPDTLKVIAGAIEVASGHDVGRLHSMAFDDKSKYTESFFSVFEEAQGDDAKLDAGRKRRMWLLNIINQPLSIHTLYQLVPTAFPSTASPRDQSQLSQN